MKSKRESLAASLVLLVLAGCAPCAWAQTYQVIFNFGSPLVGSNPFAGLTFDSHGNLLGTVAFGGYNDSGCAGGCGTVFELLPNGHGGWNGKAVHLFTGSNGGDGGNPNAPLVLDRLGNVYGTDNCTTECAGFYGGVVFKLTPAVQGLWPESILHDFGLAGCQPPGAGSPQCSVGFDPRGHLFGASSFGDTCTGDGAVFNLQQVSFSRWIYAIINCFTNAAAGDRPQGLLAFDTSDNVYGTTSEGGSAGAGIVYMLTPNLGSQGWSETVLYSFQGGPSDGANPIAGIVLDSLGNVYGTTAQGGSAGMGTVFMLTPQSNGTWKETVLHSFQGGNDAAAPNSSLTFDSAGNLYGTAGGGSFGQGTLFKLTPTSNGNWSESIAHTFTGGMDGGMPYGGITIDASGDLFGTASVGGSFGQQGGVAFEITP